MRHFEDLWVEAEDIIEKYSLRQDPKELIDLLVKDSPTSNDMGTLLFYLAGKSQAGNINVFSALYQAINEAKSYVMDDDKTDPDVNQNTTPPKSG